MNIIVDTNIVFSAILNSNNKIGRILIAKNSKFKFYSCEYLKLELFKHQEKLLKLTNLNNEELFELQNFVLANITFINEKIIPNEIIDETTFLLKNIDPFDVPFVALATHLNAKLWTGDKKLYIPLQEQNYQNIITTDDFDI